MDLKKSKKTVSALFILIFAAACAQNKTKDEIQANVMKAETPNASWQSKMQALSDTLSQLMPIVVSKKRFDDPKNQDMLRVSTTNLRSLAHTLDKTSENGDGSGKAAAPNADPTMKVMSDLFADDLDQAIGSLANGDREYARQILRDTTSYCIQCHTQTKNGPDFPHLNLSLNENGLTNLEKAEFFSATRQFDKALSSYEAALKDSEYIKKNPLEWEQSARAAIAIAVRVKNDPKTTSNFLKSIKSAKTKLPKSTQEAYSSWEKAVADWTKEKSHEQPTEPEAQIAMAEKLMTQAKGLQKFPLDHSQDIRYFRASSLIHQAMGSKLPSAKLNAKALLDAGISSEATRDMNFWTLHESYYEQCIRVLPHSETAKQCYARLKDSVTLGYSGSGGINIPPEVAKRLERYGSLSTVSEK